MSATYIVRWSENVFCASRSVRYSLLFFYLSWLYCLTNNLFRLTPISLRVLCHLLYVDDITTIWNNRSLSSRVYLQRCQACRRWFGDGRTQRMSRRKQSNPKPLKRESNLICDSFFFPPYLCFLSFSNIFRVSHNACWIIFVACDEVPGKTGFVDGVLLAGRHVAWQVIGCLCLSDRVSS